MSKETEDKDAMKVEEGFNDVQNALGKAEQFLEDHQKAVGFSVLAVVAVVAIVWLFRSYYIQPREAEAQKEMFAAQYYFEADSFKLALEGNGLNSGFLNVIDEYSSTKAGELATYYAGVCYLRLGEFENAKKYLSDYSGDDEYISTFAIGLLGDAEAELGNDEAAIKQYKKVADKGNKVIAPIFLQKLGAMYEKQGNAAEAKAAYAKIKELYPNSISSQQSSKYEQSVKE